MATDWESKYPLVSVRALERIEALSDHAPILLSTGSSVTHDKHQFKFELGWLYREGFDEMIKRIWMQPVGGNTPIVDLRGWARHTAGILKKEKARLSTIIDEVEEIAELQLLSPQQIELKCQSNARIAQLLRE